MKKTIDNLAILILHLITGDERDHIEFERGWAETNNVSWVFGNDTEFENDAELQDTGYSLIDFTTGYLNLHAKLEAGWVPARHQ